MLTLLLQQNLSIGGIDEIPDAFTFTDQTSVPISSVRTSNIITISGLGDGVSVAVTVTGGELRKNGGTWTISPNTAVNGDTFQVRHAASASYSTVTNTTLNVGGVTDTFTSTTEVDPGSVVVPFTLPSRVRFLASPEQDEDPDAAQSFRFARSCLKDPDEHQPVELDFYQFCISRWAPNDLRDAGETVRPDVGTGFAYVVDVAGTTAAEPPRWPRTLNGTVDDGSLTWRAISAGTHGINPITGTPVAVPEPEGLEVTNIAVSEAFKIHATYSGGVLGRTYEVAYTFVLDGLQRVARHRVVVRNR